MFKYCLICLDECLFDWCVIVNIVLCFYEGKYMINNFLYDEDVVFEVFDVVVE